LSYTIINTALFLSRTLQFLWTPRKLSPMGIKNEARLSMPPSSLVAYLKIQKAYRCRKNTNASWVRFIFFFLVGSLRGSIIDDHLRRLLQFPVASAHKSMQHVWGEVEKKKKTQKGAQT